MADTDAPGCRRLQICLRERPHVIGKPRPPTAALLSLPHYCCPTRLRYLWGTCTYGNHSAHCCRDWLLGLTMTVCRRRKSRSRIGAWDSSGTMCKTTRRLFWERLGKFVPHREGPIVLKSWSFGRTGIDGILVWRYPHKGCTEPSLVQGPGPRSKLIV